MPQPAVAPRPPQSSAECHQPFLGAAAAAATGSAATATVVGDGAVAAPSTLPVVSAVFLLAATAVSVEVVVVVVLRRCCVVALLRVLRPAPQPPLAVETTRCRGTTTVLRRDAHMVHLVNL
jgi:hypothetical protein